MKQCPRCDRRYEDDSLRFCLDDGTSLVTGTPLEPAHEPMRVNSPPGNHEVRTEVLPGSRVAAPDRENLNLVPWLIAGAAVLLVLVMGIGLTVALITSRKSNTSGISSNGSNYNANGQSQPGVIPSPARAMSVSGTTWAGTDSTKVQNEYVFSANGLVWNDPRSTWQQTGNRVVWDLNDNYAHYEGIIIGPHMEYQAHNKVGFSWTGSLTRIK
jgi:hypothetical protein